MLLLRVVGFTPDSMGNSIILPKEVIAQMSSDNDYDKFNVLLYHLVKDENNNIVNKSINYDSFNVSILHNEEIRDKYKALKEAKRLALLKKIRLSNNKEKRTKQYDELGRIAAKEAKKEITDYYKEDESLVKHIDKVADAENTILEIYKLILSHPESVKKMLRPVTAGSLEIAATEIEELRKERTAKDENSLIYSPFSENYQAEAMNNNNAGLDLTAIYASKGSLAPQLQGFDLEFGYYKKEGKKLNKITFFCWFS